MAKHLSPHDCISFDYSAFFDSIKNKISESRIKASRQINIIINDVYWFIGKMIAESQNKQGWGEAILPRI